MTEEKKPTIEENLKSIEDIIAVLEKGDMDLSDSLKAFEEGVRLVRESDELLLGAEKQLKILTGEEDNDEL